MITFKAKTPSGGIINSALSPFTFPAGETHIKREDRRSLERHEIAIAQFTPESMHTDLFMLDMWAQYIGRTDESIYTTIIMPYLPAARADRGVAMGARNYAEFIARIGAEQIVVFDPHSPVMTEELPYWYKKEFPDHAPLKLDIVGSDRLWWAQHQLMDTHSYDGIIAPDKGAHDRAEAVAKHFGVPVFTVDKSRNPDNGNLTINSVPDLDPDKQYLIIDDICDGGGTFMLTAKELEKQIDGFDAQKSVDLYVSHGVFSKGALPDLPFYFRHIYTTNSFDPNRELPKGFTRFDIIRTLLNEVK